MKNKAQQEIVGFVLIVALVMVGLMVFLVISLRETPTEKNSVEVDNLLNALMKQTTECAVIFEPQYNNFEDLFKSCYNEDTCKNLNEEACDYLDTYLTETLKSIAETEATISAYQLDFLSRENEVETLISQIKEGDCQGPTSSAQKTLISNTDKLVIRMKLCKAG